MIKQNEQAGRVIFTDPTPPTATNKTATNPISPAVLIFGAWLAGTLLFEISSLEDIGLRSATSDHWGIRATMLPESTAGKTEFAALRSDVGRMDEPTGPMFGMSATGESINGESINGEPSSIDQIDFRDSYDRR